jgi:general stress protein 26
MKNETTTHPNANIQKLGELVKSMKFAMLTTRDAEGHLRSRPMAVQQQEFHGDLWFFTSIKAPKVEEVLRDGRVNVSLANPDDQQYVSISGKAEIVRDHAKIAELWSPVYKAWFPKGLQDPDLALMRIHAEQAEYWDSPSAAMVQLFGVVKAAVTGESSKGEPSQHAKVTL